MVEESYAYDEITPADDVLMTADGPVILRMGEPPIPVGCGAENSEDIGDLVDSNTDTTIA